MYVISGIILCIVGVLVLIYPISSYNAFAIIFVIALAILSIVQVYNALTEPGSSFWGWDIVFAIIYAILAIVLLTHPNITKEMFPFLIAFMTLFRGINLLGVAGRMRSLSEDTSWRWIGFAGIISVILSFIIMFNLSIVVPYVDIMLVIVFFSAGGGSIYAGSQLHKLYKQFKNT